MVGRDMWLDTELIVPADAKGVVLFAHGGGSNRHNPANQHLARHFNESRYATVLADLLTAGEERVDDDTLALRFNIRLLTRRMEVLIDWAHDHEQLAALPIGLFGASTGAAAALNAAAARPDRVKAVVSRGGRPDLATSLEFVKAPTLLIVGARDGYVRQLNEKALRNMKCEKRIEVVAGATHLFREPGALDGVSILAERWFAEHLKRGD